MLSNLYLLSPLIFTIKPWVDSKTSILEMWKLRLIEVKWLTQSRRVNSGAVMPTSELQILFTHPLCSYDMLIFCYAIVSGERLSEVNGKRSKCCGLLEVIRVTLRPCWKASWLRSLENAYLGQAHTQLLRQLRLRCSEITIRHRQESLLKQPLALRKGPLKKGRRREQGWASLPPWS